MNQHTINIQPRLFAELMIGSKDYSIIDDATRNIIITCSNYHENMVIENSEDTQDWSNRKLGKLKKGLWRCWSKDAWRLTENRKRIRLAEVDRLAAEAEARKVERQLATLKKLETYGVSSKIIESLKKRLGTDAEGVLEFWEGGIIKD